MESPYSRLRFSALPDIWATDAMNARGGMVDISMAMRDRKGITRIVPTVLDSEASMSSHGISKE